MSTKKDYRKELYGKLEQEFEYFISGLKKMSPEDIITRSYEKVMKEDLLLVFGESIELSQAEVKKLLEMEKTLDFVYQVWMDSNYGYMDILQNFVEDRVVGGLKNR